MISEERLERSLKYLAETDEKHAEVTANVKYLERQLKRSKALFITADTTLKSISAKEQLYYASEEYNKATRELYDAEVSSTTLENKRDKEGLVIDIFRTLEASRRQHNI